MGIKVSITHNVEKIKLFCAYLEQIPTKKKKKKKKFIFN